MATKPPTSCCLNHMKHFHHGMLLRCFTGSHATLPAHFPTLRASPWSTSAGPGNGPGPGKMAHSSSMTSHDITWHHIEMRENIWNMRGNMRINIDQAMRFLPDSPKLDEATWTPRVGRVDEGPALTLVKATCWKQSWLAPVHPMLPWYL